VVLWRRRRTLAGRKEVAGPSSRRGKPAFTGATISAVEFPTAFPYFAAIAAIVGSGLNIADHIILVAVYNLCFVLPLLVIVATMAIAGDRAVELLTRARGFMQKRWPVLAAVIALLAGAFVTALGVTGLGQSAGGHAGRLSRRIRQMLTHPG
jgi:cytochrome c biogenesis protein CcdA